MISFSRFATITSDAIAHPAHFTGAVAFTIIWACSGPILGFSVEWQLIINTATTVLTWLMVALVQHTQNRDTRAIQTKLDELIRALPQANNAVRGIETEDDPPKVL